ncbi:lytic transglycosylase domain-containing protein [Agromyces larvae]|uniref:Lytic transglycosylase domain-containing protein n=1 Tax=Agromyces larvae TaxID=2929802 RepID=A0ABY4C6J6_9MICO|nr:lytic transglycosylase domain-containing protein [Agromyces larvae]UOE46052.1 lytic transglycosylase domain-containing protein [Agromyces larvae]
MQNQNQNQNQLSNPTPDADLRTGPTRREARLRRRHDWRVSVVTGAAVVAIAAVSGVGFVSQNAVAAQRDRVAETRALTDAGNADTIQAASHSVVLDARAAFEAKHALADAGAAVAAAAGKVDAAALASTVAILDDYERLSPSRVFALATQAGQLAQDVQARVAEFDRVAAEQAAAQAAAEAAAAAKAAEQAAGSSAASRPSAPSNPSEAQSIARSLMASMYGWGDDQFGCLVELWNHESGWNVYASNGSSGAYGIPQALPGSKMASAGADWQTNPATQITWGLGYVAGRYGTPCGAWDSFSAKGWY